MTQIGFGSFSANEGASVILMSTARRKYMGAHVISCLREPSGLRHPAQNNSHAAADPFNLQNGMEVLLGQPLATAEGFIVHPGLEGHPKCLGLALLMRTH